MDARIHTTSFGFALDTFVLLDHTNNPVADAPQLADLRRQLRAQLLDPKPGRDHKSARLPRALQHFPIATRVSFAPSPNRLSTVMEVVAQDRPGLLYPVALALQHCRLRLVTAKVATYGERAEDIFFITARDTLSLVSETQQTCLDSEIHLRLAPAPATATPSVKSPPEPPVIF